MKKFGPDALQPFVNAFQQRMTESSQQFSQKLEHWWKLREACLLAISFVINFLKNKPLLDFKYLLATLLSSDLSANGVYFFTSLSKLNQHQYT